MKNLLYYFGEDGDLHLIKVNMSKTVYGVSGRKFPGNTKTKTKMLLKVMGIWDGSLCRKEMVIDSPSQYDKETGSSRPSPLSSQFLFYG